MSPRNPSRRRFLKASAALASIGAVGALSGCSGGSGGDGGSDSPLPRGPGAVPATASSIFYVDFEAFRTDEDLKRILEAGDTSGDQSVDESMTQFKNDSGIDPAKVSTIMGFAEDGSSMGSFGGAASGDSYGGMVAWTDISADEMATALEENSETTPTESTYNDTTIYTAESGQGYAHVGSGTFVAGSDQAVKDVIDLANGSGSAISGDLKSSYTSTREAPFRFAMVMPESSGSSGSTSTGMGGVTQNISHISGSVLYANGDKRGLELNMVFDSSDTASQMKTMADQFLTQYQSQFQQSEQTQDMARMLEQMSVSQNGDTLSVSYEDTVDNIVAGMNEGTGMGMGGMATGSTSGSGMEN